MDFNQSVKSMGTKMTHFRIDEARVEKMRTRINSNLVGGDESPYWYTAHMQDGMPLHKCLAELCKRVLIHNNYRVELHPLSRCDKGGSDLHIVDIVGIKHPDANYYTATMKFCETYSSGLSNYGYFILSSPRIYRYKDLGEADWAFQDCSMKSNDMNRTFAGVVKLLPIKDRELLLGIALEQQGSVNNLLDADARELRSAAKDAFRWLDSDSMRSELIRLLAASKEGAVAPYVDGSGDEDGPIDCYEKYLRKKATLEESVEHNIGQVPIHVVRTFTSDALYCRYHSDIDEATEDVYRPINHQTNNPLIAGTWASKGDWQVYQKIEDLPVALHSKIMTLNVAAGDESHCEMRGVGMMFPADRVVKEHYVVFVKEDEEVFSK